MSEQTIEQKLDIQMAYINSVLNDHSPENELARQTMEAQVAYVDEITIRRKQNKEAEDAYYNSISFMGNRSPENEVKISKHYFYAYQYAINVINGPFPLGEVAISKSFPYSFYYAIKILKKRFRIGEIEQAEMNSDSGFYSAYLRECMNFNHE